MQAVFLHILPLLLGAAISPVATVGMIAVLTSKYKPKLMGLAFLFGAILPLLIIGIPGIFLFSNLQLKPANSNISSILDLVAGLLLLGLALKNFLKKPSNKTSNKPKSHKELGPAKSFVLGTGLMITNFSTIILFIPAVKDIAQSTLSSVEKMTVLFASIPIVMSIIMLPLIIATIMPHSSRNILENFRVFMTRHNRTIIQVMLLVFGIYLLAKGFGIITS